MMKPTKYLYGKDFENKYLDMQIQVCEYKLARIKELLTTLLSVPMYARDEQRINAILEAREFNENLLKDSLRCRK